MWVKQPLNKLGVPKIRHQSKSRWWWI
jgi:hypothetical protein